MSNSSRLYGDSDRVDLPVFVSPAEIVFASDKKRTLLTVFNPYGNEAQFRIMTTSPDRFDVSITKGTIKPNRRIDITIRLVNHMVDELPEATDELQTIDYFRITLQVGQLKGNRPVKVHWCSSAELVADTEEGHVNLISGEDKTSSKLKIKTLKTPIANPSLQLGLPSTSTSYNQRLFSNQRSPTVRPSRSSNQVDLSHNGSNVNLGKCG